MLGCNSLMLSRFKVIILTGFVIQIGVLDALPDIPQPGTFQYYTDIIAADTINVSRYPASMQQINDLFEQKCSTCHGLKDTINAPSTLPSYWEKTVQDMLNKPNSGMSAGDAQEITKFLIYDSSVRRRSKLKKELKDLSPEQQQQEQAKIDEIKKSVS